MYFCQYSTLSIYTSPVTPKIFKNIQFLALAHSYTVAHSLGTTDQATPIYILLQPFVEILEILSEMEEL